MLPDSLPGQGADNAILANTLALQQKFRTARVTLVSKDINLRIKAAILGVHAEDYSSDKTIEDADLLVTRRAAAARRISGRSTARAWSPGSNRAAPSTGYADLCCANGKPISSSTIRAPTASRRLCASSRANRRYLELTTDYRTERNNVWGVTARNREQNLALNLLMDPEIDFVTVLGPAGTGKTLLTLAAGLAQTLDHNRFSEIIMTRVTIPLGEDIGFLAGHRGRKNGALDGRVDGQPGSI